MKKISNKTLALNSLLAIVGILLMPYVINTCFLFLVVLTIAIGGFSFGLLLERTIHK